VREQAQVIRWEEPPAAKRSGPAGQGWSKYAALAEELRANPGRWALVAERAGTDGALATHIRSGQMQCFTPTGDFDAAARRVGRITRIYARYVGDQEAGAA
jgi:hypothetical protein